MNFAKPLAVSFLNAMSAVASTAVCSDLAKILKWYTVLSGHTSILW
jgi:hypothetical protein